MEKKETQAAAILMFVCVRVRSLSSLGRSGDRWLLLACRSRRRRSRPLSPPLTLRPRPSSPLVTLDCSRVSTLRPFSAATSECHCLPREARAGWRPWSPSQTLPIGTANPACSIRTIIVLLVLMFCCCCCCSLTTLVCFHYFFFLSFNSFKKLCCCNMSLCSFNKFPSCTPSVMCLLSQHGWVGLPLLCFQVSSSKVK